MEALPDDNNLTTIPSVTDDLDAMIERLKNRELLPAEVLIVRRLESLCVCHER